MPCTPCPCPCPWPWRRYTSREYLEKVHWQSPAFKEFQAKVREAGIEWEVKDVHKYHEELPGAYGYMSR